MKFGIEIEAVGMTPAQVADLLNAKGINCQLPSVRHATSGQWKVVLDGSVSNGFELVSPPLEFTEFNLVAIRRICRILNDAGIDTTKACGLHVHFDVSTLTPAQLASVYNRYRAFEHNIDRLMPIGRRGNANHYCRSLTGQAPLVAQDTLAQTAAQRSDRYYKVNLCSFAKYGTIEFRQHAGTVNGVKISNWVRFLASFIEASKTTPVEPVVIAQPVVAPVAVAQPVAAPIMSRAISRVPVLRHLALNGPSTADQIAAALNMTRASVQSAISRLRRTNPDLTARNRRNVGRVYTLNMPLPVATTPVAPVAQQVAAPVQTTNSTDSLWRGIDRNLKSYYTTLTVAMAGA